MAKSTFIRVQQGHDGLKSPFTSSRGGVILLAGYLGDNGSGARRIHGHQLAVQALAHGVLLRPGARRGLILGPISLVHVSDLGHQRIIGVRVRQQRTD